MKKRRFKGRRAPRGMTLIEIMVVLGIALYGPGAQARALHVQTRPVAEGVTP